MPTVTVQKSTKSSPADAFKTVSSFLSNNSDLKKLDPSYQCQFDEKALCGEAKGKMFSAAMKVAPSAGGSNVEITVELPFALMLAKGMVQKTLEKKLDEAFS